MCKVDPFAARIRGGHASREHSSPLLLVALVLASLTGVVWGPSAWSASAASAGRPPLASVTAPCFARNVFVYAEWQGSGQEEVGGLVIVGHAGCSPRGYPKVSLADNSRRTLHVRLKHVKPQVVPPLGRIPGHLLAYASLSWANWCAGRIPLPIVLKLVLPGAGGRLHTAIRYGNFSRRVWARPPPCVAHGRPSILTVGPYLRTPARSESNSLSTMGLTYSTQ